MKKRNLEVICGLICFIFLLACPVNATSILISPDSGTIGAIVIVTGEGFSATEEIVIDFGNTSTIATTLTDVSGSFSTTFTATPQPAYGTVIVNAKGLSSQTIATTEFNLLNPLPLLNFYKEVTPSGAATSGATLTYTLNYQNIGSGTATNVVLTDAIPTDTIYITNSATGADTTISYSHDGGITYDSSQDLPVTYIKWELTSVLASGAGGSVGFEVRVE